MKFVESVAVLAAAVPALSQDLAKESFSPRLQTNSAITSTIAQTSNLKSVLHTVVEQAHKTPLRHVYIERGGAAWRGAYTPLEEPHSVSGFIPETIRKNTTRYFYIGLQQKLNYNGRVRRHPSDIGLMIESKGDRAVPFITTLDPSLDPKRATIKVWDKMNNANGESLGQLMKGRKFFTIPKGSPHYTKVSFEKNADVTVELSLTGLTKTQSAVVLKLKSQDKSVVVTIPRNNRLLTSERPVVHAVSSSVEPIQKGIRTNWHLLLAESAETISPGNWNKFPALHNADRRARKQSLAKN